MTVHRHNAHPGSVQQASGRGLREGIRDKTHDGSVGVGAGYIADLAAGRADGGVDAAVAGLGGYGDGDG